MRKFADEELFSLFKMLLSFRYHALVTLLLDVGRRADECANLTWENVIPGFAVLRGMYGYKLNKSHVTVRSGSNETGG
jgi:integrase